MKNLAEQVDEFMRAERISASEMARRAATTRQNIDNLAAKGVKSPKYLPGLARAMRTTVDVLLAGKYAYRPTTEPAPAADRRAELTARTDTSAADRVAAALAYLLPEEQEEVIALVEQRADRARRQAEHVARLAASGEDGAGKARD